MTLAPLLSMQHINKRFGTVAALSDASIEIGSGEVHALIGENGAGKSTLIKVLTGYHPRDGGDITFKGEAVNYRTPPEAQAGGISTIHQEINLVPFRSITENICLGRETKRFGLLNWPAMHREAKALLERFSIRIDVHQPLLRFDTATQQMVAIARAIGFDANLVIMDEPTSSLDDREVETLFAVIRQLRDEGVSVVFVSHKLDELYAVCDRVTVMRDGKTVRTAAMSEISKRELVSAMLGRVAEERERGAHQVAQAADSGKVTLELRSVKSGHKVRDVSFDLRAGEIVGLAGLLGSGRTETAKIIFGADQADAGTMLMDGQPVSFDNPIAAIRQGIGLCPEDRKLEGIVPEMSVRENLTLALLPQLAHRGVIDEARQKDIVERFIKILGVRCASPDQKIRELSGGNQQKVLLARWLCMNPRLLILDEPTRGIDVGAKAEILKVVRGLAAEGLSVLMISSELEEVLESASRIFVLRDGRSVASFAGEALNEGDILDAMASGDSRCEAAAGGSHHG